MNHDATMQLEWTGRSRAVNSRRSGFVARAAAGRGGCLSSFFVHCRAVSVLAGVE